MLGAEKADSFSRFRRSSVGHEPNHSHHPSSGILDHQAFFVAITRNIPRTVEYNTPHNDTHTMSSRALSMPVRRLATAATITPALSRRSFQSSARMLEVPAGVMPVRKPVGAFRGGYVLTCISFLLPLLRPSVSPLHLPYLPASVSSTFSSSDFLVA